MSYENAEFKFIISGNGNIYDNKMISSNFSNIIELELDNNTIISYQEWSENTPSLNNLTRPIFKLSAGEFIEAVKRIDNYLPKCIIKSSDDTCLVTVKVIESNIYEEKKLFFGFNDKIQINNFLNKKLTVFLSGIPFYLLDPLHALRYKGVPWGDKIREYGTYFDADMIRN